MIIAGKYEVIEELTKTTLSIVYICEHVIKKERVIVKIERQQNLLQKEAQMYLYLKDKKVHIPKMKGTGIHEDFAYLVLSPLKQSLLTFEGSLPYLTFFTELYHLHEALVVHRDIKPQNFLIGFKNDLYLIDFGLACFQTKTPMKSFVGNKRYASFVCFEKEYVYEYKDDVISLIYMLLDVTFGYLPWDKTEQARKEIRLEDFYTPHVLLELYRICLEKFDYKTLFERLGRGIDGRHT
jgi:serine/threonine protein kinase